MNRIYDYDENNTFFNKYLDIEYNIMTTSEYKDLIHHRLHHPEHFCPAYNIVNHNKVVFLRRAKEMYPNYDFYVWVDFHYTIRNDNNNQFPETLKNISTDKISICSYIEKEHLPNLTCRQIASSGLDVIYGAMFVVPKNLIHDLYEEYEYQLNENYNNMCADDDQGIHMAIFLRIPDFYNIVPIKCWGKAIQAMLLSNNQSICK
jgi:hypothetical protein